MTSTNKIILFIIMVSVPYLLTHFCASTYPKYLILPIMLGLIFVKPNNAFISVCVAVSVVLMFTPRQTRYSFGERGLPELIKWAQVIEENDTVYGVKEINQVLYKYHRQVDEYYEWDGSATGNFKWIVARKKYNQPDLTNYIKVFEKGAFIAWERK